MRKIKYKNIRTGRQLLKSCGKNTVPGICKIGKNITGRQRIPTHIGFKFLTAGNAMFVFQKALKIFSKKNKKCYSMPYYSLI